MPGAHLISDFPGRRTCLVTPEGGLGLGAALRSVVRYSVKSNLVRGCEPGGRVPLSCRHGHESSLGPPLSQALR